MKKDIKSLFNSRLKRLKKMREEIINRLKDANNERGEEAVLLQTQLVNEEEALSKEISQLEDYISQDQSVIRRVLIQNGDKTRQVNIVSAGLVDPKMGFISNESPLGMALLAGTTGQNISVDTPNGQLRYRIVNIN